MDTLKNYQSEAIAHLLEWRVGALFMEAGTGKTRVALELVNAVPDVDLVVWMGPLQTIKATDGTSVVEEIEKWGGFSCSNVRYVGVESISASDRIFMELFGAIEQSKNCFMVVDESIKIKNWMAKRTKRIIRLGEMAGYKLILNGTPLTRNILDLWSQMEFLSPKILGMSERKYKNTFCDYTTITKTFGYRKVQKEFITGFENIDYLYSLIRHYVYQCDLNLNITQNYHNVYYEIDSDAKEVYNDIKERFLNDETLMWKNNNIFLEMTQKMQHSYSCTQEKFIMCDALFDRIPQEKTIIFTKFIDSHKECEKRYPKAKVLSYQKESLGLNLQEYNHTVYFDKIWDYALRIQSARRTFRTGQDSDCQYYDLTGNVGLERLIDRNIDKKISMSEYFKKVTKEQLQNEL